MPIRKLTVLLGIGVMSFSSCEVYNPNEEIPAYIQIDSFIVEQNINANAGSLSHDIRDAWVFIDDQSVGIYELPVKFPVLANGKHKLTIGPGIFVSTSSGLRDNYLFYNAYIDEGFELTAGQTTNVTPKVSYRDPADTYEYLVVDDFENNFTVIDSISGNDVVLTITHDPALVFEGNGSGLIQFNSQDNTAYFKTPTHVFPANGKVVYMEIDYYSDFHLNFGLFINNRSARDEAFDYLTTRPTTDDEGERKWKKAYIALTSLIAHGSDPIDYYVYFNIVTNSEERHSDGIVMIDNIKFLYQK